MGEDIKNVYNELIKYIDTKVIRLINGQIDISKAIIKLIFYYK